MLYFFVSVGWFAFLYFIPSSLDLLLKGIEPTKFNFYLNGFIISLLVIFLISNILNYIISGIKNKKLPVLGKKKIIIYISLGILFLILSILSQLFFPGYIGLIAIIIGILCWLIDKVLK